MATHLATVTEISSARLARERDDLAHRVAVLERALEAIEREADVALAEPETTFHVTRRVATIARRARLHTAGPETARAVHTAKESGFELRPPRRGIW
jgi:hypothetical protein